MTIKDFLREIRAAKLPFEVSVFQNIRLPEDNSRPGSCPLCSLCALRDPTREWHNYMDQDIKRTLGLSSRALRSIMRAADYETLSANYSPWLRKRLLSACGIPKG